MKPLAAVAGAILLSGITGYVGYSRGYAKAKAQYNPPATLPASMEGMPVDATEHRYEFKQDGATIYRFDLSTGDACWLQLSQLNANTPLPHCATSKQ
jgi:hypothetical protein